MSLWNARINISDVEGTVPVPQDHHLISIPAQSKSKHQQRGASSKRFNSRCLSPRFCLTLVVTVAFVIGIVVGILLPVSTSSGPNSHSSSPQLLPLLSHYDKKSMVESDGGMNVITPPIENKVYFQVDESFNSTFRNNQSDEVLRTFANAVSEYGRQLENETSVLGAKQRTFNSKYHRNNNKTSQAVQTQKRVRNSVDNNNSNKGETTTTPNVFTTVSNRRQLPAHVSTKTSSTQKEEGIEAETGRQMVRPTMNRKVAKLTDNTNVSRLISDGVYWSELVEESLPPGFAEEDNKRWTSFTETESVVKVFEGCGRMQNRMLVFENGTKACCRYRQNNDQIQGEIFSFFLAHLLGLKNLPPATLGLLYGREWQWRSVRNQLTLAQWNEQKPVVMTKFVDDLVPAFIPKQFRGAEGGEDKQRHLHPSEEDLFGLSREQIVELAQWSDLVIFDYLTANLDRIVNNMYNKQWNPDMMDAPAHNLAKVAQTGLLVFLDNESGLLHGYRLLDKYESYHSATLQALCVFRKSTVNSIRQLRGVNNAVDIGKRLKDALRTSQPQMLDWLPLLPDKSLKILRERLAKVDEQVKMCEKLYANDDAVDETLIKPATR